MVNDHVSRVADERAGGEAVGEHRRESEERRVAEQDDDPRRQERRQPDHTPSAARGGGRETPTTPASGGRACGESSIRRASRRRGRRRARENTSPPPPRRHVRYAHQANSASAIGMAKKSPKYKNLLIRMSSLPTASGPRLERGRHAFMTLPRKPFHAASARVSARRPRNARHCRQLLDGDEFVGLVRLRDRARPADDGRRPGALEMPGLGGEGNGDGGVGAREPQRQARRRGAGLRRRAPARRRPSSSRWSAAAYGGAAAAARLRR